MLITLFSVLFILGTYNIHASVAYADTTISYYCPNGLPNTRTRADEHELYTNIRFYPMQGSYYDFIRQHYTDPFSTYEDDDEMESINTDSNDQITKLRFYITDHLSQCYDVDLEDYNESFADQITNTNCQNMSYPDYSEYKWCTPNNMELIAWWSNGDNICQNEDPCTSGYLYILHDFKEYIEELCKKSQNNVLCNSEFIEVSETGTIESLDLKNVNDNQFYPLFKQKTIQCSAGQYLTGYHGNCKSCKPGYYCSGITVENFNNESDDQGIKPCPAGSTSSTGAKEISDCFVEPFVTHFTFGNETSGYTTFSLPASGKAHYSRSE